MTAILVEGHDAARAMIADTAAGVAAFRRMRGRAPRLAIVATTTNAAARAYVDRIETFAQAAGVDVVHVDLSGDAAAMAVLAAVDALDTDDAVDAILPLAPLPPPVTLARVAARLSPAKDVDGLSPGNGGRLAAGLDGLRPCTPRAAIRIAADSLGELRGRTATVVGASATVGWPLATMLVQRGVTVTVAHADTRDLAAACRTAELLFVAVGRPGLIDARHLSPGVTVIDIGINPVTDADGGRAIVGDVVLSDAMAIARAITAVPDGVGPLTTACLIDNTLQAARARANQDAEMDKASESDRAGV